MESHRVGALVLAWCLGAVCGDPLSAQTTTDAKECAFEGRAVDEEGKPVAGAAVGVFPGGAWFDTAALLAGPRTTTDASGRYRIAAVASDDLTIVVAAKGRQVCTMPGHGTQPAAELLADALLLPGSILTGRVRSTDGKPLPGARIHVEDPLNEQRVVTMQFRSGAVADDKGIFVVPGVPRTGLRVHVTAPGHLTHSQLAAQQSPLDVTLEPVGVVRGRVVDESGACVAGISVHAITVETRGGAEATVSDAEGRFVVTVPKKGAFRVAGSERVPPHRVFSSTLLRGPGDDVVVSAQTAMGTPRPVTVRCIDATTKAPIATFRASWGQMLAKDAEVAMMHHLDTRAEYRDAAQFRASSSEQAGYGSIVVDADGHAFAIVAVPDEGTEPLVIELGPECVVTGRVVDSETNLPIAGVAVRALPSGGSMGGGPDPRRTGTLTDADGRYRIGGLRAGEYAVQAYGIDRPSSRVFRATVGSAAEATLDLEVPKRRWLEFSLSGEVPPGLPPNLVFRSSFSFTSGEINDYHLPAVPSLPLGTERSFKLGPVGNGDYRLQVCKASRVRLGSTTTFDLGALKANTDAAAIELPDLRSALVRGRVLLPDDVPTERIAVLAHPAQERGGGMERRIFGPQPQFAGVEANGAFVLDAPLGKYVLQLADLETGILFYTDAEVREIAADSQSIELKPAIHWLEIELAPATPGAEVVLQSFGMSLPRPGIHDCGAFLQSQGRNKEMESGSVPFRLGATRQRWLVPPLTVVVKAVQTFEILQPWANGWRGQEVDTATVFVADPVHKVTLNIPAPPSDEELLRRPPK